MMSLAGEGERGQEECEDARERPTGERRRERGRREKGEGEGGKGGGASSLYSS